MARAAKTKRSLLIVLIILLVAGASVAALELTDTTYFFHQAKSGHPTINYGPATESDKADSEARKDAGNQTDGDGNTGTNVEAKLPAAIEIGSTWQSGGNFNVNGFVSNITENDGTCTLIATKGTESIKKSRDAVADATTTNCGLLSIPLNSLSTGTWEITLQYSSPKYNGLSNKMKVDL